jgi:hypothetical protein
MRSTVDLTLQVSPRQLSTTAMSLESRCLQFHEVACTGSKPPAKEIATLRKFLHKNQQQRFTDKAVARLFDTIHLYAGKQDVSSDLKESLLEDALKLPHTVFSTKQKMKMLKMLEDLRGKDAKCWSPRRNDLLFPPLRD